MSPPKLTARECEVLALIARGVSTHDIAVQLGVTPFTVRKHRTNIAAKFGLRTTSGLVSFAIRHLQEPEGGAAETFQPEGLSGREMEVLQQLGLGLTAKEIGRVLCISPRTVSKHLENIRFKTGRQTLAELMMLAGQLQLPISAGKRDTHSE